MSKANEIFRKLQPWQCDALDIAWPDDVEADLELARVDGTADGLYDWIMESRAKVVGRSDELLEAAGKYRALLHGAINGEAVQS